MKPLPPLSLSKPGLFIAGTDTGVGKTVVSCAIALAWSQRLASKAGDSKAGASRADASGAGHSGAGYGGGGLGVSKPLASDCLYVDGEWVNGDALSLQRAAGGKSPLADVNPIRFKQPLAPAVAAEEQGVPVDWRRVADAVMRLDRDHDAVLVEGVGGLLVPLDPDDASLTCLDLIRWLKYPVVVVARSVLGTLNHTAMTVALLKQGGGEVAGVVMNGFDRGLAENDPSVKTNRDWIQRMTGVPVLAVVPKARGALDLVNGEMEPAIAQAVAEVDWSGLAGRG